MWDCFPVPNLPSSSQIYFEAIRMNPFSRKEDVYFMNKEILSPSEREKTQRKKERLRAYRLTQRDFKILKFIDELKYRPSSHDIRKKFWPKAKTTQHHCHYRRLRVLQELGLLRFIYVSTGWGYDLTAKAEKLLGHFNRTLSY